MPNEETNLDREKPKGKDRKRMTEEEKKKKFGDKYDPDFKRPGKREKEDEFDPRKPVDHNDPLDYALSDQIARDFGSIPYNTLTGVGVRVLAERLVSGGAAGQTMSIAEWNVEAVAAIEYANAYFSSAKQETGLNMAAMQLYTYTRSKNSGAKNYEAADEMMLILAMRDIYAGYSEIKRAIGVASTYSLVNRAFPKTLADALRIDVVDLQQNIAKYRGQLNVIAKKINSIAVPDYFRVFRRTDYITSNIFGDSNSIRGQFYVYVRKGYYTWNTTADTQGTALTYTEFNNGAVGGVPLSYYIDILDDQINAILADTDANTISGDILKAFMESSIYRISEVTENYTIAPVMDEDILAQIENSYALSGYGYDRTTSTAVSTKLGDTTASSMNVRQSNGLLMWQPVFTTAAQFSTGEVAIPYPTKKLFNSHKDEPTYLDNLEWSRLITIAAVAAAGSGQSVPLIRVEACGAELLFNVVAYTTTSVTVIRQTAFDYYPTTQPAQPPISTWGSLVEAYSLQQYDWHPIAYFFNITGRDGLNTSYRLYTAGDMKKYTWVTDDVFSNIHDCANAAVYYKGD